MRERMVRRYYCDHCGKGGCSKGHMARHERGCTLNRNRVCGLCAHVGLNQKSADELVDAFRGCGDDDAQRLASLRDAAEGCPACILTALRILFPPVKNMDAEDLQFSPPWPDFDFKKELADFWREVSSARAESDGNQGVYY